MRALLRTLHAFSIAALVAAWALAAEAPPGHLVLIGGGDKPGDAMAKFIELAGGPAARIVAIPTASSDSDTATYYTELFRQEYGCPNVVTLDVKTRDDAMREDWAAVVAGAGGIFFGGGDQSRITRALLDTAVGDAVAAAFARGAVVGGTSAGTACQSSLMITGEGDFTVIRAGNVELKHGLGLLRDVVVDQHFIARQRSNRLISVILEHPDMLGVGIDEDTAIWVRPEGTFQVLGERCVMVLDARNATVSRRAGEAGQDALGVHGLRVDVLLRGETYDLRARRVTTGPTAEPVGREAPTPEILPAPAPQRQVVLPVDHRTLTRTIPFDEMEEFLRSVDGKGGVTVSVEGQSVEGRPLYMVHLGDGAGRPWRVLLYAQQHGDEVSGKDALLYLVRDIARDPDLLPEDVDLWVMPMVNPDGAVAGTRENAVGADLNRDHIVLEQPETQALHRLARRLLPHVAVDCHEFSRDPEGYRARGWLKWPDITMDSLNNPLFDRRLRNSALRFLDFAAEAEREAGHRFLRYRVGGVPPEEEQRHSAPDIDGGLNALGMYGGLSFIVEAAVRHAGGDPDRDLGNRVDAYLVLFRRLLRGDGHREEDLAAIEEARRRPLPGFLPTNYLWVNPDGAVTAFPVVDQATGAVVSVATANMMTTMAVKRTVPTPRGYAVAPSAAARFRGLLERHGIPFEVLASARSYEAERCALLRVEEEFDDVYSRYEGRQIVRRDEPGAVELAAGSLWIPLDGEAAVRAALVLEPAAMYGLYQYPGYRELVAADGTLPVWRVVR